jgi:membrane-bound lytic murein transglycosylase D
VRKGDTLGGIARFYRVDLQPILELNRLKRSSLLSIGMNLIIPIPKDARVAWGPERKMEGGSQSLGREEITYITYTIKRGDSLWSIANEMGVNIGALSRWNNLHRDKKLLPGDKLRVRINTPPEPGNGFQKNEVKEINYIVREGDTLWSIAQKYNVTIEEIRSWNSLDGGDRIYPSDRLKLKVGGIRSSTLN